MTTVLTIAGILLVTLVIGFVMAGFSNADVQEAGAALAGGALVVLGFIAFNAVLYGLVALLR